MEGTDENKPLPEEAVVEGLLIRGQQWESRGDRVSLQEALRCYERALHALQSAGNASAYGVGIVLMNRGNALQKFGVPAAIAEAVKVYDEAIRVFQQTPAPLPPPVVNSLGAAWINRGQALQQLGGEDALAQAIESQEQAIAWLKQIPLDAAPVVRRNLAGAWLNLADVHLNTVSVDGPIRALQAAREALELVGEVEAREPEMTDIGLKTRRAWVVAAGRLLAEGEMSDKARRDAVANGSDLVESGLKLALLWEGHQVVAFRPIALRLFRLGAQLYRQYQPQFLGEFVLEFLGGHPGFGGEAPFLDAAREELALAEAACSRPRMIVVGEPESDRLLAAIQGIRAAQARIGELASEHAQRAPGDERPPETAVSPVAT